MPRIYERQWNVFDGSSGQSSTFTSNPYLVGDAGRISVSWDTDVAVASLLTVQASNDPGLASPITTWDTWTAIAARGTVTISNNTYARWMRFTRSSLESLAICNVQFQSAG